MLVFNIGIRNKKAIAMAMLSVLKLGTVAGQPHKDKVLQYFNCIVYYPDSAIKSAGNLKNGQLKGYAIEFDSLSKLPYAIGKYKHGLKNGRWTFTNGGYRNYAKGNYDFMFVLPGCGNGAIKDQRKFQELYLKLLHLPNDYYRVRYGQ